MINKRRKGAKTRKQTVVFTIIAMLIVALGCNSLGVGGSGRIVREKRDVTGFTGIELGTIGKIILTQGKAESVEVETDDNILPLVETKAQNGILTIRSLSEEGIQPTNELLYYITVRDLESLVIKYAGVILAEDFEVGDLTVSISGAGRADFGSITSQTLEININGSGNFNAGRLETDTVRVNSAGAGDIGFESITAQTLDIVIDNGNFTAEALEAESISAIINITGRCDLKSGRVGEQVVTISRSGVYFGDNLESENTSVLIEKAGAGTVRVWATKTLDVEIRGAGTVFYKGEPVITSNISGNGSLRQIQ